MKESNPANPNDPIPKGYTRVGTGQYARYVKSEKGPSTPKDPSPGSTEYAANELARSWKEVEDLIW